MNSNEKLKAAFNQALALPPGEDLEALVYGDSAGWDSVAHMVLIAEIEREFDIMLDTDQVIDMSSFQKAREIVATQGVSFSE